MNSISLQERYKEILNALYRLEAYEFEYMLSKENNYKFCDFEHAEKILCYSKIKDGDEFEELGIRHRGYMNYPPLNLMMPVPFCGNINPSVVKTIPNSNKCSYCFSWRGKLKLLMLRLKFL